MELRLFAVVGLLLFFLPFTQALTINIGFSLKVSEIVLIVLTAYLFFEKKSFFHIQRIEFILVIFFIWAVFSFIVNSNWSYDYLPKEVPYRINRVGDSLLRVIYIALCFISYFLSKYFLIKKISLLDFWIKGALVAAFYGWYLSISSYLEIPFLKLPGMLERPQSAYGIIRSGTFREGNFFGMFLILSAAISFYRKDKKKGWFFLFSIVSTFSTISFISGLFFIAVYYSNRLQSKKRWRAIITGLVILLIVSPFILTSKYAQLSIGKIMDPIDTVTKRNFSSVDRSLTARIAYNAGMDNPFLGIGPYNYGNHYDQYNDINKKIDYLHPYLQNYFERRNHRAIPNNVYLEVWAEYGILGFLMYISFLLYIIILSYRCKERAIFAGCMALLLSMNAFPSFIMLFLWVFMAIPSAIMVRKIYDNRQINTDTYVRL